MVKKRLRTTAKVRSIRDQSLMLTQTWSAARKHISSGYSTQESGLVGDAI